MPSGKSHIEFRCV